MTQPFLSIQNVEKYFATVRAVAGVSLDIRENEFFALLGASGSGKTTLLRMLAGFEDISGGDILIEGTSIARLTPNQRPVNLMFQSYALFPHMTVAQNIAYGLEMEKLPKAQIRARVDDILKVIQLGHLAGRKPDQLSGGQRQRVALARALVKRPKVLLLDEPSLGLAPMLVRFIFDLVEEIRAQGYSILIVEQNAKAALRIADRAAVIEGGKIVMEGSAKELASDSRVADAYLGGHVAAH